MAGMTEEQMDYEAERLLNAMDRLQRLGKLSHATPCDVRLSVLPGISPSTCEKSLEVAQRYNF